MAEKNKEGRDVLRKECDIQCYIYIDYYLDMIDYAYLLNADQMSNGYLARKGACCEKKSTKSTSSHSPMEIDRRVLALGVIRVEKGEGWPLLHWKI
jgi:hypothetical protein